MAVFLRKLLRIGGLPAELRAEVEAEGVIYFAEYVPVTRRFSGKIPGKRAHGNVASYVGSLVLTNQRVLGHAVDGAKVGGTHHRSAVGRTTIGHGDRRHL